MLESDTLIFIVNMAIASFLAMFITILLLNLHAVEKNLAKFFGSKKQLSRWADWENAYYTNYPGISLPSDAGKYIDFLNRQINVRGQLRTVTERKRDSITKAAPKTFYYLDESQVKDLYSQTSQEPEPTQIETQESETSERGIKARIWNVIEPRLEQSKSQQTKKTFEIEMTTPIMYNKVEKLLFSRGDIAFGIEDFEPDESAITDFQSNCSQMHTKFNFSIPDEVQAEVINEQKRSIALKWMEKLSQATGYVALQADFTISTLDEQSCTLSYIHPLSAYLSTGGDRCFINIVASRSSLTPSGTSLFKSDSTIKLTCIGKVVCWNPTNCTLLITPIAIY